MASIANISEVKDASGLWSALDVITQPGAARWLVDWLEAIGGEEGLATALELSHDLSRVGKWIACEAFGRVQTKYGEGTMKRLAESAGYSLAQAYRFARVYSCFPDDSVRDLSQSFENHYIAAIAHGKGGRTAAEWLESFGGRSSREALRMVTSPRAATPPPTAAPLQTPPPIATLLQATASPQTSPQIAVPAGEVMESGYAGNWDGVVEGSGVVGVNFVGEKPVTEGLTAIGEDLVERFFEWLSLWVRQLRSLELWTESTAARAVEIIKSYQERRLL